MRWLILASPAICHRCHKVLVTGRGAFWESGVAICLPCATKQYGSVPVTADELQMNAEARGQVEEAKR